MGSCGGGEASVFELKEAPCMHLLHNSAASYRAHSGESYGNKLVGGGGQYLRKIIFCVEPTHKKNAIHIFCPATNKQKLDMGMLQYLRSDY